MKTVSQEISETLANPQKDIIDGGGGGGCKPKIKDATLIADYNDGGLKDVDIDSKFESLKFMWIQKLKDDSIIIHGKFLLKRFWKNLTLNGFFYSNLKLSKSDVKAVRELPSFYKELIFL